MHGDVKNIERPIGLVGFVIAISPFVVGAIFYLFTDVFELYQIGYILGINIVIDIIFVHFMAAHMPEGIREALIRGVRGGILLVILLAFVLAVYEFV